MRVHAEKQPDELKRWFRMYDVVDGRVGDPLKVVDGRWHLGFGAGYYAMCVLWPLDKHEECSNSWALSMN